MPKVSVVIPTHNRPALLKRALESVYAQTFTDFEVIVVDDGNSPSSLSVLGEYLEKENFTYLETVKNQGAPAARNIGIKHARGEFIAFLDDDDEWMTNKLKLQIDALLDCDSSVLMVFNGVVAVDKFGNELYSRLPRFSGTYNPLVKTLTRCFIWTSAIMARKSALDEVRGFDESLKKNQEWDLQIRLLMLGDFCAINAPNTILHMGETQQMGSSVNLGRITEGYQQFLTKHAKLYRSYPVAYAARLFYFGCLYAQNYEYKLARKQWVRAMYYGRDYFRYIKHYLSSFIPPLYRRLHHPVLK